jgi:glycerate-2-kinase
MGITNLEHLLSQGNIAGRRDALAIIEAGLQAADPYAQVRKLLRLEGQRLVIGNPEYEPLGSPTTGEENFDLSGPGRIFVFGAGKGVQRAAQAIEDLLGDRLAGGHLIDKKGGGIILERIGVTLGAHPVPDEDCVRGCERIRAMAQGLTPEDLVFTIGSSGFSSLLTMPVPGVSLRDVQRTVYLMQIERGAPTSDLSPVRNHLDMMKGGRISALIRPAHAVHIMAKDPGTFDELIYRNSWFHTLPDHSTFADARQNLQKWDAWDEVPQSVRDFILAADPTYETIKPERYLEWRHRIFGIMPGQQGNWPAPKKAARDLGYLPVMLAKNLRAEASSAGQVMATIAETIAQTGEPFKAPVALFTAGELVVTVGQHQGIGGRNQEYVLSIAHRIAGNERIVAAAVDTDGTDGPGSQYVPDVNLPTLAGGIVDGHTLAAASSAGIDLRQELRRHNTTPALLALNSGILATQNTGLLDLGVILVMG